MDSVEIRVTHIMHLLERYCATAEDDSAPAEARMRAARSVKAVVPTMRDSLVLRSQIHPLMMGRIARVVALAGDTVDP